MNSKSRSFRGGFTLVEIMVVILIIGIMLAMGAGFARNTSGSAVSAASAQAEAFFSEARAIAVGGSRPSRVLIDMNDTNSENYLRRIVIAAQKVDKNGLPVPDQWELTGGVLILPKGVFFSKKFSRKDFVGGTSVPDEMWLAGGAYEGAYAYYEFNTEGICSSGVAKDGSYTSPTFIIGGGVRDPGGEPRTVADGRRNFRGFVICRNGSTSVFREPGQIMGDTTPSNF